jgi:hypothetical protein
LTQTGLPFLEYEEDAQVEARSADTVIPFQPLAEIGNGEHRENGLAQSLPGFSAKPRCGISSGHTMRSIQVLSSLLKNTA